MILPQAFTVGYLQKKVKGWNYPTPETGRPSATRDWLFRAIQMLAGFVANDTEEAVSLNVSLDGDGKPLSGENRYEIRFGKGSQPPVEAFWSVAMYNMKYHFL